MKNLSIASIVEKNKLSSDRAWLIALKIFVADPLSGQEYDQIRLVANDEPVTIEGEEYKPIPMAISSDEKAGELPSVKVTIQDQSKIVMNYIKDFAGGVGWEVELHVVHGDQADNVYLDTDLTEFFEITTAGADDYVISWELGAENPLTRKFPARRQFQNQCSWRYMSGECGYQGEMTGCDLTLDGPSGCRAHNNSLNFGAFPGIVNM